MEKNDVPKLPSFIQMAKTFSKELSAHIKAGQPALKQGEYEERLEACNACPHLKKSSMRCGKCGCFLEHKAKWRTSDCPDTPSRWKAQDPNPIGEIEIKAKVEAERLYAEQEALKKANPNIQNTDGKETL
tara:strand:+ start:553 stop:942 length:390 start_codon:yes stop_codon:yes gene_type:complete